MKKVTVTMYVTDDLKSIEELRRGMLACANDPVVSGLTAFSLDVEDCQEMARVTWAYLGEPKLDVVDWWEDIHTLSTQSVLGQVKGQVTSWDIALPVGTVVVLSTQTQTGMNTSFAIVDREAPKGLRRVSREEAFEHYTGMSS